MTLARDKTTTPDTDSKQVLTPRIQEFTQLVQSLKDELNAHKALSSEEYRKADIENEIDFIKNRYNPKAIKPSLSGEWKKIKNSLKLNNHMMGSRLFSALRDVVDTQVRAFAYDLEGTIEILKNSALGKKEFLRMDQMVIYENKLLDELDFDVNTIIFNVEKLIKEHAKYLELYVKSSNQYLKPFITQQQIEGMELLVDRLRLLHSKLRKDDEIIIDCTEALLTEYQDFTGYVRRSEYKSTRDVKEELQKLQDFFIYTERAVDVEFKIDRQEKEDDEQDAKDLAKDMLGAAASFFLGPLGFKIAAVGVDLLALLANLAAVKMAIFLSDDGAKQIMGDAFSKAIESDVSFGSGTRSLSNFADQIDKLTLAMHKAVLSKKSIQKQVELAREVIFKECDQAKITLGKKELEKLMLDKVRKVITEAFESYDQEVVSITKRILGEKKDGIYFASAQAIAPLHALAYKMTLADTVFNQYPGFSENPVESMSVCFAKLLKHMDNREGDEKIIEYVMSLENIWCDKAQLKKFGFVKEEGLFDLHTTIQYRNINAVRGTQRKITALALLVIFKMFECHGKTIIPEMMQPEDQARAIVAIAALGICIPEFKNTTPNVLYEIFKSIKPMRDMFANPAVIKALRNLISVTVGFDNQLHVPAAAEFVRLNDLKSRDFQSALSIFVDTHNEKKKIAASYSQISGPSQNIMLQISKLSEDLGVKSKKRLYLSEVLKREAVKKTLLGYYKPYADCNRELSKVKDEIADIKKKQFMLQKESKVQQSKMQTLQTASHYYGIRNALINTSYINNIEKISDSSLQLLAAFSYVLFNAVKLDSRDQKDPASNKSLTSRNFHPIKTLFSNYKSLFDAQDKLAELFRNTPLLHSLDVSHIKAKRELFNRIIEDNYQFLSGVYFKAYSLQSSSHLVKLGSKSTMKFEQIYPLSLPVVDVDKILNIILKNNKDIYCFTSTIFPWDDSKQREVMQKILEYKHLYIPIFNPFTQHWSLIDIKSSLNKLEINYIDCSPFRAGEKNRIEQRILQQFTDYYYLKKDQVKPLQISVTAIYTNQQPIVYSQLSDTSANFLIENLLNGNRYFVPNGMDEVMSMRKQHLLLLSKGIPSLMSCNEFFKTQVVADDKADGLSSYAVMGRHR
jgi:uncharacterized protein YlzI (FlbEa/FlbD family)